MGIDVAISRGDVFDTRRVAAFLAYGSDVVESYEDETYPLLSGIDPYGQTIFNQLQMPRLIEELERRFESMDAGPERLRVGRVLEVARECRDDTPHTYLVFVGD